MFELTRDQKIKLDKWIKENVPKRSLDPTGASITYLFTPTSIGTIIKVKCGNKEIDLTEYHLF